MMKILKIFMIAFIIILLSSRNILALEDIFTQSNDWITTGSEHTDTTLDTEKLKEGSNMLYNLFLGVATVIAVIVGAILGVMYMVSGISEKAQVKEALFPYIVSCIVVFGSFGIWKLAVSLMNSF